MQQDYKKLFEQAIYHLHAVSGSRNSFTPEMFDLLLNSELKAWRTPEVECIHKNAYEFLKQYVPQG